MSGGFLITVVSSVCCFKESLGTPTGWLTNRTSCDWVLILGLLRRSLEEERGLLFGKTIIKDDWFRVALI